MALTITPITYQGALDASAIAQITTNLNALIAAVNAGSSGSGYTFTDSLTAHAGGGQTSALALTTTINRVTTVGSANDSVKLPLAAPGQFIAIINDAASNSLQVYGAGTDTINDVATATGVAVPAQTTAVFYSTTAAPAGKWYSNNSPAIFGKLFVVNNSLTLAGTDSTTMTFPTTSATIARTDAANTFTGTQTIGALVATTVNGNTITAGTGTLTLAAAKTLTANNSLTLAGTDATTVTFPTTSATVARTDAGQTFTGVNTLTASILAGDNAVAQVNYIASETGANNAIVGTFTNAPALAAGLRVSVLLAHSLQAGANTFAYAGGGALNIKSHRNTGNNIATAYVSGGIVDLMYDGAQWQDMSQ